MKLNRKMIAGFAFMLLFAFCAYGQNAPLTKDSVIQMVKAGLSDDIIISKIRSEPNLPTLSTDDLIALKAAGVSDGIIRALVAPPPKPDNAVPQPAPQPAAVSPPPDPNDPNAFHDPGVYLMTKDMDGKPKMVFIDRAGAASVHTAGGIGAKMKAEIPGAHAPVRSREARPVLYMYFPSAENVGGLGGNSIITSPSQFSLLKLEEKKNHRETAIAKAGFFHVSAGVDEKKAEGFSSQRIRNGMYKLTPDSDLGTGEYAFVATSGTAGTRTAETVVIYDFGLGFE